ncbi:hypothetical protein ACROYT_G014519 [Oculina patagonica]
MQLVMSNFCVNFLSDEWCKYHYTVLNERNKSDPPGHAILCTWIHTALECSDIDIENGSGPWSSMEVTHGFLRNFPSWKHHPNSPSFEPVPQKTSKMFSKKTTQDALTFMFMEDVIGEIEFLLLYESVNKRNPSFPYLSYDRFDLTCLTEEESRAEFGFGLAELPMLVQAL